MSINKFRTRISCDHVGCEEWWGISPKGPLANERQIAAQHGWVNEGGDYCPTHAKDTH